MEPREGRGREEREADRRPKSGEGKGGKALVVCET